eukprot:4850008-Alexandrium_andersonii.AAC.1
MPCAVCGRWASRPEWVSAEECVFERCARTRCLTVELREAQSVGQVAAARHAKSLLQRASS